MVDVDYGSGSSTLPGYTSLPEGATTYARITNVTAVRIEGPFLVRGENSVSYISDGWLVQGSDGHLFGVEDAEFAGRFSVVTVEITATEGVGGTIDPQGVVAVALGAEQAFTVTADPGFALDEVLVDDEAAVLTDGAYTFTNVTAAHTIAATFVAVPVTITASAGANGAIDPVGATEVVYGEDQVFTVTPDALFDLDTLLVDDEPAVLTGDTYTFTNVVAAHTIAATFIAE